MNNLTQHFSHKPALLVVIIISLAVIATSVPYFLKQQKRYGSLFEFASKSRKVIAGISCVALLVTLLYSLTPYVAPASDEIAIVLGNTQNTPNPKLSGDVADAIEGTMLRHKGDDVDQLADSIKLISAVKNPEVIDLDASELRLREVGNNSSNAKRSVETNVKTIEETIATLAPSDNGANYLEAILEARDNVQEGAKIVVIGSGLSDSGDLNFSKTNILTNEQTRKDAIRKLKSKYGHDYLDGYTVMLYGLGDTAAPQEALSSKQRGIVRDIYEATIRGLGGTVETYTKTLIGEPVKTNYVVGTTDTGCGDIGLIFDDDNLKFVSNQAVFTDEAAAKSSLTSIKNLWDAYGDNIQTIQIDGYIAHYAGADNLSQDRANLVKQVLLDMGVPPAKLGATGRGFGPYEQDVQNRIVKVTISRNSDQCGN
jgi:outer membrane protein OmpA-like peptidoglycan-associated protein